MRRTSVPPTVGKRRRDGLPAAVRVEHLRPGGPAARVRGHEVAERRDRAGLGDRVRVGDEDQLPARGRGAGVDVGGEAERRGLLDHRRAERIVGRAAGQVGDHDRFVDLRQERGQRPGELLPVAVRDDDRRHLHARPSTSR